MKPAKTYCCTVLFTLALLSPAIFAQNTVAPAAVGTASVAGRVTVDGGALAGLQVLLQREAEGMEILNQAPPLKAATDADGNFRFSKVPAGKYRLQVYAPVYIKDQKDEPFRAGQSVNVGADENIENLNFSLRRGGVITGKVTDDENRPMIEEAVKLIRLDAQGKKVNEPVRLALLSLNRTDDRGVYRLFGVEPGRYLVAVGAEPNETALFSMSKEFQLTYHPRTAIEAEARIIEIAPGAEVEGVNIVMVRADAKKGYVASGRVIEADTGKPVPGVMIAYSSKAKSEGGMPFGMTPATTNSQGEFRLEGLAAGSYSISVMNITALMGSGSEFYGEPLNVEITGSDVSGLELKMSKGAVIVGRVVLDGAQDPKSLAKLAGTIVQALPDMDMKDPSAMMTAMSSMAMGTVGPDGSFKLSGARPGKFSITLNNPKERTLKLLRVEQNGAVIAKLEVTGTTAVNNVRLVVAFGTATLMGRVEVRGGALPPGTRIRVIAKQKDTSAGNPTAYADADARGQFTVDGIVPGVYEVSVGSIRTPDNAVVKSQNSTQTVVLADNARQEVLLVVELTTKEK
ncbi:MAG: carboxypeptidase regulatory-like domain-containing protein [Acidobacteria bacterium]|nr:carboxypeptidase regulatory-like domain-containing protein [Acidobacteriota bacterium]MBI3424630.1 carboxypeptidase regulatory-like domain-containing protein [Acidobacteriota bacterium]